MSDKKEVLLRIRVDEAAATKKIVDYQKEINATKKAQQELAKAIKEAGGATEAQATQQVALKAKLKDLTSQQNLQIKTIETQQKMDKAKAGSINQLRAQLSALTMQWNELSEEERENADIGGKLEKQTKKVSDELKRLEGKVGDTRRNVGNYTESILQATDGSGKLSQAINTAKEAYAELKGFISDAKEALVDEVKTKIAAKEAALAKAAAENAGAAATGAATTATKLNKAAIIGNVGALKLLKFALAATGIGLVLLLLGGLISFLTRTQDGIDLVSTKTKGFTTVMGVLIDKLSAVGKQIIDFVSGFENLGDAVKKLAMVLWDHLITRLKGFGVILEGILNKDFSKIQDGVAQIATGITDATAKSKALAKELNEVRKAAEAIEKENQRLRESERALNVEREKANAQIEKYKMVAEDTTKSESVRADAARKAFALEENLRNRQLTLQRDKIANIIAEQKLTNNLTADNEKLAEAEIELARIEKDSIGKSIELQNKLNQLRQEGASKAREATLKQLAAEAALLEIRIDNALNSEEDILNLRLQLLQKKTQQELKQENLTQLQIKVIKEKALAEEDKLRTAYREEQRQKELDETERTNKAAFELSQKLLKLGFDKQNLSVKEQRARGLLTEKEYQEKLSTLQLTQLQAEVMALQQFEGKIVGIEEQIAAKRLAISNLLADGKIKDIQKVEDKEAERLARKQEEMVRELEMTGDFVAAIGEQVGAALGSQEQSMEQFMANIAVMAIDTISQVLEAQVAASIGAATVGALVTPDSIATFGATGIIRALALIALIKAGAAAAKAAIQSAVQPKGQYYDGGYTGDGGKYEPAGVVHKGEVVFSQEDVARAGGVHAVEAIRLRGYSGGGIVTAPRTSVYPSVRNALGGGNALLIDYEKLGRSVGKYVPKYIKTTDIKGGLAKDQRTVTVANQ